MFESGHYAAPVVLKSSRVLCGPEGWQGSLWSLGVAGFPVVLRGGRVPCGSEERQGSLWSLGVAGLPVVRVVAGFPVVLKGGRVPCVFLSGGRGSLCQF